MEKRLKELFNNCKKNNVSAHYIHPAQDYYNGKIFYSGLFQDNKGKVPVLISSDKKIISFENTFDEGFILKPSKISCSNIPLELINDIEKGDVNITVVELYNEICNYIKKFIVFQEESLLSYSAIWTMGTYIFRMFRYYPYIWINGEKGTAKSLLMEILSNIAFNGKLVSSVTPASIFRIISENLTSLFIDEFEGFNKKNQKEISYLKEVIYSGYADGSTIIRVNPNNNFKMEEFFTYAPKGFAGINEIGTVLRDRSVKIHMIKKLKNEIVDVYTKEYSIYFRKLLLPPLYKFGLFHCSKINNMLQNVKNITGTSHLLNRDFNIWLPVFIIANLIGSKVVKLMEELSKKEIEEKKRDDSQQDYFNMSLNTIKEIIDDPKYILFKNENLNYYESKKVYFYFKNTGRFDSIKSINKLTGLLKRLNIISIQKTIKNKKKGCYIVDLDKFKELYMRHS